MEENRTRRALDELADLFLTGPTGGPPSADSSAEPGEPADAKRDANGAADAVVADDAPAPAPAQAEADPPGDDDAPDSHGSVTSHADFDALAEFDLQGPTPIRLSPKVAVRSTSQPSTAEPDEPQADPMASEPVAPAVEAKSHLRLHRDEEMDTDAEQTADDASRDARLPESAHTQVEAVLLGNLPGLSGPWLTQYAQRLAQREGPVLLLHLDEQGLDMELVEPTDRPQPPGRVPPGGQARDLVDRLETLVRLAPHPVRRVLVHVEANPKPMVLARLRALDAWTLLTGADDAATVAGYRLLKRMIETDPAATPRRVGVMMLGSDDEAACRGIARLRSAASSFLDSPVELIGAQRQMVPVNIRQLGRFEPMQTLWPSLRRWLAGLDPAEVQPAREPARANDQPVELEMPAMIGAAAPADSQASVLPPPSAELFTPSADAPAAPDAEPSRASEPAATAVAQPEPAPPAPAAAPAVPRQPEPATTPASADEDAPGLAAFLTRDSLVGGIALEARCPHQPDTELLLDQNGRLHLLRRHQAVADRPARTDDDLPALRQAMIELLEARAWVREHVALLQLTQRQCHIDGKADPVLHLFTHRADLATALTARLGTVLKLHLLQKVGQEGRATWFSTPLN